MLNTKDDPPPPLLFASPIRKMIVIDAFPTKIQPISKLFIMHILCVATLLLIFIVLNWVNVTAVSTSHSVPLHFPLLQNTHHCKVLFYIHIPKTGGTSISKLLVKTPGYVGNTEIPYVSHGRDMPRGRDMHTMVTELILSLNDSAKTLPLLVSAEVGILDLLKVDYPLFNITCFYSVSREPHEWLISAENHMRVKSGYRGGFTGTVGYFDEPNIQARMLYYQPTKTKASPLRPLTICVFTLSEMERVLCEIQRHANMEVCLSLGHQNSLNHSHEISPQVETVVREKYSRDLELWRVLLDSGGEICY